MAQPIEVQGTQIALRSLMLLIECEERGRREDALVEQIRQRDQIIIGLQKEIAESKAKKEKRPHEG